MASLSALASAAAKNAPPLAAVATVEKVAPNLIPGVDLVIVAGLMLGLFGGSLWRAEDARARSRSWEAAGDSLLSSAMRGIVLFIIAWITYEFVTTIGGMIGQFAFRPGPVGAAGIGMVVGVKGPSAFSWFEATVLGRKTSSDPSRVTPPDPNTPEDLQQLTKRFDDDSTER